MFKNLPDNFGAFIISLLVTLAFAAVTAYAMVHGVTDNATLQGLVGSLTTAFSMVVSYWIGSSAGSKNKDAVIAAAASANLPTPGPAGAPGPTGPTGPVGEQGATGAAGPTGHTLALALLGGILAASLAIGVPGHAWAAKRCIPYPQCEGGFSPAAGGSLVSPGGLTTVNGLTKVAQDPSLVAKLITDLTQFDTVAGRVNPRAMLPAPYNTYLPEAHQCIAAAVPWLQNVPTVAAVPSPLDSAGNPVPQDQWGAFTTLGMLQVNADNLQAFVSSINTDSVRPLKIGCAAWAQRIITTPTTILGTLSQDVMNFITIFGK